MNTTKRISSRRVIAGANLLALVVLLAACNRNAAPMTPCVGDVAAIERTQDVAPPNCP